jgi:hypothetical protein
MACISQSQYQVKALGDLTTGMLSFEMSMQFSGSNQ